MKGLEVKLIIFLPAFGYFQIMPLSAYIFIHYKKCSFITTQKLETPNRENGYNGD